MNKKVLTIMASLICVNACSDDSTSTDSCNCQDNEKCFENVCYDQTQCDPSCAEGQICKDGLCYICNKTGCYSAGSYQDSEVCNCQENEKCFQNVCYDQTECDPSCAEGQICKAGKCYICSDKGCFSVSNKKTCQSKYDCPDGQECNANGYCQTKEQIECSPACQENEICVDGQCKPSDQTLLWQLCRSGSTDCTGSLKCLVWAKPSKEMYYKGVHYGTADNANIPMSEIDSRVNVDTYNDLNDTDFSNINIGICSLDCTADPEVCPLGWSCQVIAKADSPYYGEELPFSVDEKAMKETGFSAICRPNISESMAKATHFSQEMCGSDEAKCKAENRVFYKGMCLEPCDNDHATCPLMFYCGDIDDEHKACMPNQKTCGACADLDGDGQGAGHCTDKGYDCNDEDANIYYGRNLACSDIDNADQPTDLNCNGVIDRFELLGTSEHCQSCTDVCPAASSSQATSVCVSEADPNWVKTAQSDADIPEFKCDIKCHYGYGDCKNDGKCSTALLNKAARESENPTVVYADTLIDNAGKIFGIDDDQDGYIGIDNESSVEAGKIVLDEKNSVICCGNDTSTCYTANGAWNNISIENDERYVAVTTGADNPASFDRDDHNPQIAPNLLDKCDGLDNDGSTILVKSENLSKLPSCDDYCKRSDVDCDAEGIRVKCFDDECDQVKTVSIEGEKYRYVYSPKCDATPDGYNEIDPYIDPVHEQNAYYYGEQCVIYNQNGGVCNDTSAFVGCISRDSSYQLACISNDPSSQKDGIVTSGGHTSYVFNNLDDNCNGLVDEDAMQPCLIIADMPYNDYREGSTSKGGYGKGVDNTSCVGNTNCNYIVPTNDNDYPTKSNLKTSNLSNLDQSIPLCRIGVLRAGKEILDGSGKGTGTYEPKCVPLYQPREYDFFGDGIDSNCDGADYDTLHAIFVSPLGDGSGQTGSNEATCKFDFDKNMVNSPCTYLDKTYDSKGNVLTNGALAKAIHGGDPKNTTLELYSDILIAGDQTMELPVTVPVLAKPAKVNQFEKLQSEQENDHILSPFELHQKLIELYRKTGVNVSNRYLFSFDQKITDETYHTTTYEENSAYPIEKNQPDEAIRIYGGFTRNLNSDINNPDKKDIWTQNNTSSIKYDVDSSNIKNDETIAMFRPQSAEAKLSLKLDHLAIEMLPSNDLPPAAVNGISFIGIDGSAGISNLTLSDTSLTVTGANGYSYTEQPPQMPVVEFKQSVFIVDFQTYQNIIDYHDYFSTNTGGETDYNQWIENKFDKNKKYYTGHGGGQIACDGKKGSSVKNWPGKDGYYVNSEPCALSECAKNGRGASGNTSKISDHSAYDLAKNEAPFIFSYQSEGSEVCGMRYEFDTGEPGETGGSGKNGISDKVKFEFLKQNNKFSTLYLDSNRTESMGDVGQHGGGGGAGALLYCERKTDGSNYQYAHGGAGGRGGRAGMTGGTGASAFGIVARSDSAETMTHIHIMGSSRISVKSGDSGKPQLGQNGQMGFWANDIYGYISSDCNMMYSPGGPGGGGGAGGAGAGGRAGLAFPIIASCNIVDMKFAKPSEKCIKNNNEDTDIKDTDKLCLDNNEYETLKNCGFDFNDDFINSMNSKFDASKGSKWPDIETKDDSLKPIKISKSTYDLDLPEVKENPSLQQSNSNVSAKYVTSMPWPGANSGWCHEANNRTRMTASGRLSAIYPTSYQKGTDDFCLDSDKNVEGTECIQRGIKMLIEKDGVILHGPAKEDKP